MVFSSLTKGKESYFSYCLLSGHVLSAEGQGLGAAGSWKFPVSLGSLALALKRQSSNSCEDQGTPQRKAWAFLFCRCPFDGLIGRFLSPAVVAKSHIWITIQSNVHFLPKRPSLLSVSEESRLCGVCSGGHAQEAGTQRSNESLL